MAQPGNQFETPEHYEETRDPRNPPNSVLQPRVRRAARWSFLTPIIALTVIAGLLWMYWSGQQELRNPKDADRGAVVGTSGDDPPVGATAPTNDSRTLAELKFRGVTSSLAAKGLQLREPRGGLEDQQDD